MVLKTYFLNFFDRLPQKSLHFTWYGNVFHHNIPEMVNLAAILYIPIRQKKNLLGNRANHVRHTLIMLKSQVPDFYSKILLGF